MCNFFVTFSFPLFCSVVVCSFLSLFLIARCVAKGRELRITEMHAALFNKYKLPHI